MFYFILTIQKIDIEYWRVPSRKFYITKFDDYEQLKSIIKRNKLSTRKRYIEDIQSIREDASQQIGRVETNVKKVQVYNVMYT